MFTPIKNFITYIQKNASGNSIFGGNIGNEESSKMETENMEAVTENGDMKTEGKIPQEIEKNENSVTNKEADKNNCEESHDSRSDMKEPETKTTNLITTSTVSTENSCEFEVDDIEAQIERSIMLKKPVKVSATSGSEILEVKKSLNASSGIVISHDFNRNQPLNQIDDELDDFRNDPMELLGTISSPYSNQQADEFRSVGSAEEAIERDVSTIGDIQTEEEEIMDGNKTQDEQLIDSDVEVDENKEVETENEQNDVIDIDDDYEDDEDEEEPFLDLDNFKSKWY